MSEVLRISDIPFDPVRALLHRFRITLELQTDGEDIRGSFWGAPEAGIVGTTVYVRGDTPIHSLLHECSHIICMTGKRRAVLDRDAGGGDLEEAVVCYLQILLADHIELVGSARLMQDMDRWGYSFRLGSTRRWFEEDAEDMRTWLLVHGLLDEALGVTFRRRK